MKCEHIVCATLSQKSSQHKPRFKNITSFFIRVVKVLFFELGLVWRHFLGEVPAQSGRREASTEPFFDRLDTFSITN